jgi:hypothetical protein
VSPIVDVSIEPETDNEYALREGGTLWRSLVEGVNAGLEGSLALFWAAVKGIVPIFDMIFIKLFRNDGQSPSLV